VGDEGRGLSSKPRCCYKGGGVGKAGVRNRKERMVSWRDEDADAKFFLGGVPPRRKRKVGRTSAGESRSKGKRDDKQTLDARDE